MSAIGVRPAVPADAPAIARIHWDSWVACYSGVFPQASFDEFPLSAREVSWRRAAERAHDSHRVWLAVDADDVALGFASTGPWRANGGLDPVPRRGELNAMYLAPECKRQGIGRALWHAAASGLRDAGNDTMWLWVIAANQGACRFYAAMGAEKVAVFTFDAHGVPIEEHAYRFALESR